MPLPVNSASNSPEDDKRSHTLPNAPALRRQIQEPLISPGDRTPSLRTGLGAVQLFVNLQEQCEWHLDMQPHQHSESGTTQAALARSSLTSPTLAYTTASDSDNTLLSK